MKPILFNTEMVKAILEGRKTVTRRVIKPQPTYSQNSGFSWRGKAYGTDIPQTFKGAGYNFRCEAPYQVGDILWVRETWRELIRPVGAPKEFDYKAERDARATGLFKWKPSIHMPKEAARIFLRVTDVRVERLQDITNVQILAEGTNPKQIDSYIRQMPESTDEWIRGAYFLAWGQLWDETIKKDQLIYYGHRANPYVWVIEFEPISKELAYELERQKEAT